jgi:hypothetical protein
MGGLVLTAGCGWNFVCAVYDPLMFRLRDRLGGAGEGRSLVAGIDMSSLIRDEEEITSLNERLSYIKSKIKECSIAEDRVVQAFSRLNSGKMDDED